MAKFPVLMYHNVSPTLSKGLTISCQKLEAQLQYLVDNNYTFYFASELVIDEKLTTNSIVITFDDATENQLIYALPILKKYNSKATFFIPFNYIGKTDIWNQNKANSEQKIMTIEQLKSIDSNLVEFGYHSFNHNRYSQLSSQEINDDFKNCEEIISSNKLQVAPTLAYPYGDYPKKGKAKETFFSLLEFYGIKMAFRIGNRVNFFPFKNKYEMKRIDIKGEESLFTFKLKLIFGKLRLF